MEHDYPAVKQAKKDKRRSVPYSIAVSFDLYNKIMKDAEEQRRPVAHVGRIILEDHYQAPKEAQA